MVTAIFIINLFLVCFPFYAVYSMKRMGIYESMGGITLTSVIVTFFLAFTAVAGSHGIFYSEFLSKFPKEEGTLGGLSVGVFILFFFWLYIAYSNTKTNYKIVPEDNDDEFFEGWKI
jgi:hypothetical protein